MGKLVQVNCGISLINLQIKCYISLNWQARLPVNCDISLIYLQIKCYITLNGQVRLQRLTVTFH